MENPFDLIESRLERIEKLLTEIKQGQSDIKQIDKPEDLPITIKEAAELLHLTVTTIYTKVTHGELPGVMKRGKRLYFSKAELINYINQGRKKSNAEIDAEAEKYIKSHKS
jgi:excisionase family DNA binding protein